MATVNPIFAELPEWRTRAFRFAIAFLRVGFGLVFLTNGLAKLTGWDGIHPFPGYLIDYDGARNILHANTSSHPVGLYKDVIDNVVLDHYTPFGIALTATELFIGLSLVSGAFSSLGALVGAGFALNINFSTWDRNPWAWEAAVEWMPLIALAFLAAGRCYGLDQAVATHLPKRLRRWPIIT